MERGTVRSGSRYNLLNKAYHLSFSDLIKHHSKLLSFEPSISHRSGVVDETKGFLVQTIAVYRFDCTFIESHLRKLFSELFLQVTESAREGFEVSITFNVVLSSPEKDCFTLFYGLDHSEGNERGVSSELNPYGKLIYINKHNYSLNYCIIIVSKYINKNSYFLLNVNYLKNFYIYCFQEILPFENYQMLPNYPQLLITTKWFIC